MPEFLGSIAIPDPVTISAFPLTSDYGGGFDIEVPIVTHLFDQPGLKTEQRFVLGSGARRFRVRKDHLSCSEYDLLKAHWQSASGMYAQFPYTYRGAAIETVTARYENPSLAFPHLVGLLTSDPGVTLLEIPPTLADQTSLATVSRFPDATLTTALQQQVQTIIPLVGILPRDGSAPIYLSNRRCTINGTLFQPRILDWSGISQTIGESADTAQFTLGNADGVFTQLVNTINLAKADVQFSLFHLESRYLVNLWAGYALPWSFDAEGRFTLRASDGVFELSLGYPSRTVSRTCWKVYKGRFCPSVSALPDCPKSWDACVARLVPKSFGGMMAKSQDVHIKDNTTGTFGWGRSSITSVTVIQDTIYERPVQEVYTDKAMKVVCDVAGGRDESEFYSALGIVGEGPISGYSIDLIQHKLDDQPPHDPQRGGGWRGILGADPAATNDFFALDQAPWNVVPPGATYAAGLAFAEIRRTDEEGLQLSKVADRKMVVTVTGGIAGWVWTAPGTRVWTASLSNCVWVAINVYLRGIGLRLDSSNAGLITAAVMEQYFDVNQAIAAAAIADLMVDKLVGTPTPQERQFPFRGVLKEKKPLKDWLQEILNCCLGYFTFANGKLWIGIRVNSSTTDAFTQMNILHKSLQIGLPDVRFNHLTVQFGDEEFDWQLNNVTIYDIDHAAQLGSAASPQYIQSTMSLVGVSNKSQATRICATRLKEEVGGVGPAEQRNARTLRFRTTVLSLKTMVGDIISLTHPDLPGTGTIVEGRVQSWVLNPDFSIDIAASPTTDAMYNAVMGPKPPDVPADPVIPEILPSPNGLAWMPNEVGAFAGDPLYPDLLERTFDLWQDYAITREGVWDPAIWVRGEFPIDTFVAPVQPRITGTILLTTGGTLVGGQTIYLAVTVRDAAGKPAVPSNLTATWIPAGVTVGRIQLLLAPPPSGTWAGYDVWAGTDRRRIGWQSGAAGALPGTINFDGPVHQMTQSLPTASARAIRVSAKHVWHSGVAGLLITGVTAPNQLQCNDAIGSTDNWVGRILSALADQSDGSAPLWNFSVTAFTAATGVFTVTPNCVRAAPEDSVQTGDVLIVRSKATSATATTVTDTLWNNSIALVQFGSPGLAPSEEIGRIARILRGKGAGQFRYITGNTSTQLTVAPAWDVQPDTTSVIIVEAPDWTYAAGSSAMSAAESGSKVEVRVRLDNLRDRVALVGGFLVDDEGRFTDEEFAVYREIYIFGQPPTVRMIGPAELDPATSLPWQALATDHTIRVDTTANDVAIQLPPLYVYQGRVLQVFNDGATTFRVMVHVYPGETFADGSDLITAAPGEMLKITAG